MKTRLIPLSALGLVFGISLALAAPEQAPPAPSTPSSACEDLFKKYDELVKKADETCEKQDEESQRACDGLEKEFEALDKEIENAGCDSGEE